MYAESKSANPNLLIYAVCYFSICYASSSYCFLTFQAHQIKKEKIKITSGAFLIVNDIIIESIIFSFYID